MKTPRDPEKIEQVKTRILDKALDIIISGGLDALTMRKLAARTGMTAPNLYNYFSGKDEIYLSIVIRGFEMLHAALRTQYDHHDDKSVRARAMIDAYMQFGMAHPQYYDIMFTRPTPKYNDYLGTPFEHLSETEYTLSMEIAAIAGQVAADLTGRPQDDPAVLRRVIQIWSLLHGMITLHNSGVVDYVTDSTDQIYRTIIDEFLESMTD